VGSAHRGLDLALDPLEASIVIIFVVRTMEAATWWIRATVLGLGLFAGIFLSSLARRGDDEFSEEFSPEELAEIRRNLARLRRDLSILTEEGFCEDLAALLGKVFDNPEAMSKALIAWVNLTEELVQDVEVYHGSDPGLGRYKKSHLKGALLYGLHRSEFDIPRVPSYLEPIMFDLVLDPLVEAIVRLVNRQHLWVEEAASKSRLDRYSTIAGRTPVVGCEWLSQLLTRFTWWLVFALNPVSPRIKMAVDTLLQTSQDPLRKPVLLMQWIAAHHQELLVVIDLVAAATVEAERLIHADGARKKAYAREVILVFIEDTLGLPDRSSLSFWVLETVIDVAIDSVVFLFNKRAHPIFKPAFMPDSAVAAS